MPSEALRDAAPVVPPPTVRTWFGLAVLLLPVLLVSMDVSVLFLAMPTIADSLQPTGAQQLWILDIYGFLIAGLLITMGNLGDRIGRRRILLSGAALFGIASVIAAFAPNPEVLIAARALQGVGGATLMPASLSLIANMFADPQLRARAIGIWTAAFAGGAAIGPVVGGVLLHHYWWGVIFLINVPVLLVLLAAGPFLLPEYRTPTSAPFDLVGVAASLAGILPLVYGIKTLAADGPSAGPIAAFCFGVAMLAFFLWFENRVDAPLLKLRLFRDPAFRIAVAAALVCMMAHAGMAYLANVYLQSVLGYDVLVVALAGLPMAVSVAVFSVGAATVTRLAGTRLALTGSLAIAGVGTLGFSFLTLDSPLWFYLVASAVAGIGLGVAFSLISDTVVSSAPPEEAGAASGISETSFELGTALGLALLGSLATAVFLRRSDGRFADSLSETLRETGALGAAGEQTAAIARQAFVDGLQAAAIAAGVALLLVAAVAAHALRPRS